MDILFNTPALNVYQHMAFDEQAVRDFEGGFILRFYHWTPGAAVTFGYAQFAGEVEKVLAQKKGLGPFARRPTGGGMVFHGEDLTFSCIFCPKETRPSEIYKKLHGLIGDQLAGEGLPVRSLDQELPACAYAPSVDHLASRCFVNPVCSDLVGAEGKKILGGAIRRFGNKVLYQGSLQTQNARTETRYKTAIIQAVRRGYAPGLLPLCANAQLLQKAFSLAKTQYETEAWTQKFK